MKKCITGCGIGSYENFLWIMTFISLLVQFAVFLVMISESAYIQTIQIYILSPLAISTIVFYYTSVQIAISYWYSQIGFKITKNYLVLPVEYAVVGKFRWENVQRVYKQTYANVLYIDVIYTLNEFPQAKKYNSKFDFSNVTDDTVITQTISVHLLRYKKPEKNDFIAVGTLHKEHKHKFGNQRRTIKTRNVKPSSKINLLYSALLLLSLYIPTLF